MNLIAFIFCTILLIPMLILIIYNVSNNNKVNFYQRI